jgi:hypothetical protein
MVLTLLQSTHKPSLSYIGTLFKVKLYRILVYSGFGLDNCICKILYFYILHNLYFSSNFDGFFSKLSSVPRMFVLKNLEGWFTRTKVIA